MPVRATVLGTESLQRKLDALGHATRGQMLERAVVAGALLIQNAAKEGTPFRTGTLRRSIHIGGHDDLNPDGVSGKIDPPEVTADRVAVFVGTDVEYARRVEYGFEGDDVLGRTYHQPAQPYLRPAVDETRREVVQEIGEALRDLIRAAVR